MRYKRGSAVEVLCRSEVPSGSWRCAHIVCGNGHNYTVKYQMGAIGNEVVAERVGRNLIRPCPPPVELSMNWSPGDVVEVFLNYSWKMATVSVITGRNQFLVRLVGSSKELAVSKFDIRVRQSWENGKWIIVGKAGNYDNQIYNDCSSLKYSQISSPQVKQIKLKSNLQAKDVTFCNMNFQESRVLTSMAPKRKSHCSSAQVVEQERTAYKFRLIDKEGRHHQAARRSSTSHKIVDDISLRRDLLYRKEMQSNINCRNSCTFEMDLERSKTNGDAACSQRISIEPYNDGNFTCSVDSCSISSNDPFKFPPDPVANAQDQSSDAESICCTPKTSSLFLPAKEELAAEVHRLELHAYRCTLEALHASGPLSWEQETLITNLRISLHISNDEHLMELRNLISNTSSIPSC